MNILKIRLQLDFRLNGIKNKRLKKKDLLFSVVFERSILVWQIQQGRLSICYLRLRGKNDITDSCMDNIVLSYSVWDVSYSFTYTLIASNTFNKIAPCGMIKVSFVLLCFLIQPLKYANRP